MSVDTKLSPVDIVQAQLDAYNAQDLEAYCGFFADDVVVADLNGQVTTDGIDAYRARYAAAFAQFPQNRAELVNRMVVGSTVIDHERVFRSPDAQPFEVAAIYTLAGGKVARVDFVK